MNTICVPKETHYSDIWARKHGMCDTTEQEKVQRVNEALFFKNIDVES